MGKASEKLKLPGAATEKNATGKAITYVALLRGINVGGKNRLPMPALVEIFSQSGCANVRSYIQSGNIIFTVPPSCAQQLPAAISGKIAKRFGFNPPVVLRTAEALARAANENPFLVVNAQTEFLHIGFLAATPAISQIKTLDPHRSPGDSFEIRAQEIYLNLPNGVGKTKLTNAYFDAKLQTVCTFRNWRTVLKLMELAQ